MNVPLSTSYRVHEIFQEGLWFLYWKLQSPLGVDLSGWFGSFLDQDQTITQPRLILVYMWRPLDPYKSLLGLGCADVLS